jgi:hypothetical protein
VRFFNLDIKFLEVLNSYFTTDLQKNEAIVRHFAASGEFFDDEDGGQE